MRIAEIINEKISHIGILSEVEDIIFKCVAYSSYKYIREMNEKFDLTLYDILYNAMVHRSMIEEIEEFISSRLSGYSRSNVEFKEIDEKHSGHYNHGEGKIVFSTAMSHQLCMGILHDFVNNECVDIRDALTILSTLTINTSVCNDAVKWMASVYIHELTHEDQYHRGYVKNKKSYTENPDKSEKAYYSKYIEIGALAHTIAAEIVSKYDSSKKINDMSVDEMRSIVKEIKDSAKSDIADNSFFKEYAKHGVGSKETHKLVKMVFSLINDYVDSIEARIVAPR